MPYRTDEFAAGEFYHVYNRGLAKQKIYMVDRDYERFKESLAELLPKTNLELHAYCLMPNHFHLMIRQCGDIVLTELMNRLLGSYAQYFNKKYDRRGNLFEGRFKVKRIDSDEYALQVSKYIHRNPGEAGLVKRLLEYPWSSYRSYLSDVCEPFVTTDFNLNYFSRHNSQSDYQQFVEEQFESERVLKVADYLIDIEKE